MKQLPLSVLCIVLFSIPLFAQNIPPEYGEFSELMDKNTVYVLSDDFEARKTIVKEVEEYARKGKITASVVGKTEEAEIVIIYAQGGTSWQLGGYREHGELAVAIRGKEIQNTTEAIGGQRHAYRILYSTRSSKGYSSYGISFQKSPHKKAIRKFLDAWGKFQKTGKIPKRT